MIHEDEHGFPYFSSFDDILVEGLTPIKVWNLLQFFTLAGRKTAISQYNMIPIPDLKYIVLCWMGKGENLGDNERRFYVREYHNYDIETLFFYRKSLTFSGDDEGVEGLRRYVEDGRVWIILTNDQIVHTQDLLKRLYKSYFSNEGKIDYRVYLEIVDLSLKREDFIENQKNITGYKTTIKILDDKITALWKQSYNEIKP